MLSRLPPVFSEGMSVVILYPDETRRQRGQLNFVAVTAAID